MKEVFALYNPITFSHRPELEYFNCQPKPHQDSPERITNILRALHECGFIHVLVSKIDEILPRIGEVHEPEYLQHLEETSRGAEKWSRENNLASYAIYPSVHPFSVQGKASNKISRRGLHCFDTYTPIMKETYDVAVQTAGVALESAKHLVEGQPLVYAATRPSGHHAEKAMSGGYCYLNNAAIAAEYLTQGHSKKVAILDIDLHHGNGTQHIFYDRSDVLVVNINADPHYSYPHFSGYADEVGVNEGEGANFNFPLPTGVTDDEYGVVFAKALQIIHQYRPQYLVVSAGFDTHKQDPIGTFKLTTEYYQKIGQHLYDLALPTLVVQEGGYATEVLGKNVVALLTGLNGQ